MLIRKTKKRLSTDEWYGEWFIEGYEDHALHGMTLSTEAEVDAYGAAAEAALLDVLRRQFPDIQR